MTTRITQLLVLILALTLIFSCGKSQKQKELERAAKKLEKASKEMAEAGEEMARGGAEAITEGMKKMGEALGGGEKVEPVDFRDLKELLPKSLPSMKRMDATGERTKAFGIHVSKAEGNYESRDGDSSIDIEIVDMGSIKGLTAMATLGWAFADIDRETDSGYEKSTEYSGHKAFEEYDKDDQSGKIHVLVAKRFHVEVKGYGVKMKAIKKALDEINIRKLEKMKDFGVKN